MKSMLLIIAAVAGVCAFSGYPTQTGFAPAAAAIPEPAAPGVTGAAAPGATRVEAPGEKPVPDGAHQALTFSKDIAPLMYQHCASCHRPGESAPFPLLTYGDVQKRAAQIVSVTQSHFMPPWKALSHGEFADENQLAAPEIGMIKQWADEGAKEGDRRDLPPMPQFASGWTQGEPDAIFQPLQPYTVAAEGPDEYHTFVIPTTYGEDRYISAVEARPGNRSVVHHTLLFQDTSGKARERAAGHPGMDYTETTLSFNPQGLLSIWAPGNFPRRLPDGIGMRLPKGADLVLQVHYHRSGKPEIDRTRIGVYFCKGPIDKELRDFPIFAPLSIPPGNANYETHGGITVPFDATLRTIMPHMHLLGKEMTVTASMPDGTDKTLIHVPAWDFNWQATYTYREPLKLPAGTRIKMVARFDNSTGNPRNPHNPPEVVSWGEQTTNEMCIAFLGFTVEAEHLNKTGVTAPVQP